MRCLKRNTRRMFYANFTGYTELVDAYGKKTGEKVLGYTPPIEVWWNVSDESGYARVEDYGLHPEYERSIVIEKPFPNISETSVLWIDVPTTDDPDYMIKRVSRGLNEMTLFVGKPK